MGKVDVIQAIFDSYELVKAHYKEVALPLLVLLMLSGASGFGGNSLSNYSRNSDYEDNSYTTESLVANAITGIEFLLGAFVIIVILVVLLSFVIAILSRATWFYVYEHFYAILRKGAVSPDWKSRMKRHAVKALVLILSWLVIVVALIGASVGPIYFLSVDWVASLAIILIAAALLVLLMFLLSPLWIYYVMDNRGFFDSLSRSIALVTGNLGAFIIYFFITFLVGIGEAMASLSAVACCLAWVVGPLLTVFFGLIMGITLMKMKLALDSG